MIADLMARLAAGVGLVLLSEAFGLTPPPLTREWWCLIVAAILLGHVAASMSAKEATE